MLLSTGLLSRRHIQPQLGQKRVILLRSRLFITPTFRKEQSRHKGDFYVRPKSGCVFDWGSYLGRGQDRYAGTLMVYDTC